MKISKYIIPAIAIFFINGCEFFDEMFNFDTNRQKQLSQNSQIVFQKESSPKTAIITAKCKYNQKASFIYYKTVDDIEKSYFKDIKNLFSKPGSGEKLKPFWDIRYVNEVQNYSNSEIVTPLDINKSNNTIIGTDYLQENKDANFVSTSCQNGVLTSKASLNLFDTPNQYIEYGGPQSSFIYRIEDLDIAKPWKSNKTGNLMLEAKFNKPIYKKFEQNRGGNISFGFMLYNKKLEKHISYVVAIYTAGDAWLEERAKLHYDTSTGFIHVATNIDNGTWWSTKSPKSESSVRVSGKQSEIEKNNNFKHFFRVNITYDNLKAVLKELQNNPPAEAVGEEFGDNPQDWQVTSIFIQFELEEDGGKAIISSSFKGFEAYSSKLPL